MVVPGAAAGKVQEKLLPKDVAIAGTGLMLMLLIAYTGASYPKIVNPKSLNPPCWLHGFGYPMP